MLGGVQVNVGGVQNMLGGGCTNEVGGGGAHPPHPPRKSASVQECPRKNQLRFDNKNFTLQR